MSEWQDIQEQTEIVHGKHKGKMVWEVIRDDPNYALYASKEFSWFPKLTPDQSKDCQSRYKFLPISDWSTYGMADYGDNWS